MSNARPPIASAWLPETPELPPRSNNGNLTSYLSGTAAMGPFGALGAGTVTNPPLGMLLRSIITVRDHVPGGRIVEAVRPAWDAIADLLCKDPDERFRIPADKWEELIAASYEVAGYKVKLTKRSGDGGVDVVAIKEGFWTIKIVDQVKALAPGRRVTAEEVRALLFVVLADPTVSKGLVTTTAEFAPGIATEEAIQQFVPTRLELIDGPLLIERFTKQRER